MAPTFAASWRRSDVSHVNSNDSPAGSDVLLSSPALSSAPGSPDSGADPGNVPPASSSANPSAFPSIVTPSPPSFKPQPTSPSLLPMADSSPVTPSSVVQPCSPAINSLNSNTNWVLSTINGVTVPENGPPAPPSMFISSAHVPRLRLQRALAADNAQNFVVVGSTVPTQAVVPATFDPGSLTYASSVTISTQPVVATTSVAAFQDTVATKSDHKGIIIGGAVGGVALLVFFLAFFCCMRKHSRRSAERPSLGDDGMPAPHRGPGKGPEHGEPPEMKQVIPTRGDSLNRSSSPTGSAGSPHSGRSRRGKRPPPLQPESLVTPVINGPTSPVRKNPFADPVAPSLPSPDFGGDPFRDNVHQSPRPGFTVVEIPRSPAHVA